MDLQLLLSLHSQDTLFVNPRRIRLLEQIRDQGSISRGAKAAGISYKSAWDAVKDINALADQPVVLSETGGKGGGGALLTPYGERLLKIYGLLNQIERMAVDALQDESTSLDSLLSVVARFSLQTSARNQFFARVTSLDPTDISRKVCLTMQGDIPLYADITERSCQRLGLTPGKEVLALIKAPWVTLEPEGDGITDNDNVLAGCISDMVPGEEFDEYSLLLDQGELLCALLSKPHSQQLNLSISDRAQARFAPSQVILATLG
ncbi:molybdenum-dependent transcriptional regulator [Oceanisphaera marina]|uniref:Molybdenum-dependent transcriptional regulator n=1 Tax=Oceanisphaera marina TaxID=2017550 RepID=A0ABQ1IWW5_9GAMM|nr:TOBE domain-containing protein [Oceanisphaera marina]GGB54395.1 molybdenum-dependent transcriptional regulator [Oceanisphaera marina]